jgi:hypothetical protein
MSISFTVTAQDFKDQFFRDFNYSATLWNNTDTYNTDDIVYYTVTLLYYKALNDGLTNILPTDSNNWVETPDENYVLDEDIEKAFKEAELVFNESLFSDEDSQRLAFLYLTAHYLIIDLNAAFNQGQSGAPGTVNSRSVGNVSESYTIPKWMTDNELLAPFALTPYGQKYISLLRSRLVGNAITIQGATQP